VPRQAVVARTHSSPNITSSRYVGSATPMSMDTMTAILFTANRPESVPVTGALEPVRAMSAAADALTVTSVPKSSGFQRMEAVPAKV
jgi:hypothetical protein